MTKSQNEQKGERDFMDIQKACPPCSLPSRGNPPLKPSKWPCASKHRNHFILSRETLGSHVKHPSPPRMSRLIPLKRRRLKRVRLDSAPVFRLVMKQLDSSLRPVCPSQHGIHRHHHQGGEGSKRRPLCGCHLCCPLSR